MLEPEMRGEGVNCLHPGVCSPGVRGDVIMNQQPWYSAGALLCSVVLCISHTAPLPREVLSIQNKEMDYTRH